MNRVRRWWPALAGGAALGAAAVLGTGVIPALAADDKPAEKKAPEAKPSFKAEDVQVGAPPELEALRKAVEKAGKKGENVDEIRQQLDALEKAMNGRAWVKPQPPVEIVRPGQAPRAVFPDLPDVGGPDVDALRKIMEEQQRLMRDALGGRIAGVGGFPGVPGIAIGPADPLGRRMLPGVRGEGRLGVRLEQVPIVVADQLELPAGRGLVVSDVVPGSAAEKAGLKVSDIILEFDGLAVTNDAVDLVKRVNEAKTGEKIDITVLRKGKKETLKVELPDLKRRQAQALPFGGAAGDGLGVGNSIRFSNNNGMIEIQATQDGVGYGVKGEMIDGKLNAKEITVTEGESTTTYDSMDKVPEAHRTKVQNLLGKPGRRID